MKHYDYFPLKPFLTVFLVLVTLGSLQAQNNTTINGRITDETNAPLPGVTVSIKGTSTGTITNNEGLYSLTATNLNGTLVFSFIGYNTKEVAINNRNTINESLAPDTKALKEVVVVGYGTRAKSEVTAPITSVKAAELTQTPIANLAQGLQGRVAGLQITQNNAAPGGSISVRLRGTNSINGSSEPLYIIDGVQITNSSSSRPNNFVNATYVSTGGEANDLSPLSTLNPNDIESIEVLKDASAAAIYGSQAANGVIIITTKRGKAGASKISYDGYYGIQEVTKKLDMLNATEYAKLENEVFNNPNRYPKPDSFGVGTDWQDVIFRQAPIQSHQLNFSGGNDKTQILLALNYFSQ